MVASVSTTSPIDRFIHKAGTLMGFGQRNIRRTVRLRRIMTNPTESRARKAVGRELAEGRFTSLIPKATGYAYLDSGFPGLASAVAAGEAVLRDWDIHNPGYVYDPKAAGQPSPNFNILNETYLAQYPAILDFALSVPMAQAVAGYLGEVPSLVQVDIRVTPPQQAVGEETAGPGDSRAFHVDDRDDDWSKVRCIILLNEVTAESGPFTFVPRAASDRVRKALGRRWWGSTRFRDWEVMPNLQAGDLAQLTGGPGQAILIDTGRCLHYGNRTQSGRRAIIMLQYKRTPGGSVPKRPVVPKPGKVDLTQFARADDPAYRQLLLAQPR